MIQGISMATLSDQLSWIIFAWRSADKNGGSSSEHFHLEEGETVLARGNENFRAQGENRTRDPNPNPTNTRSDVLTTETPGL